MPYLWLSQSLYNGSKVVKSLRGTMSHEEEHRLKGEKLLCGPCLRLRWSPHQCGSPGVRWTAYSVFHRQGLSRGSHRLVPLSVTQMFLASQATDPLCWGITSRCSTKERPCHPTESKQTSFPICGHSAAGQISKGLAVPSL